MTKTMSSSKQSPKSSGVRRTATAAVRRQQPPTKIAVSTPQQAISLLRTFMAQAVADVQGYAVRGSRTKWYSADQITSWYLSAKNQYIHSGWLGRSLHAGVAAGMRGVTMNSVPLAAAGKVRTLNVYR